MSQPGNPTPPHFSGHKLRQRAAAGLGFPLADQLAVQRLFNTEEEHGRPTPHVIDVSDVTRGLGVPDAQRVKIEKLIEETRAGFSTKSGTQRVGLARGALLELMRSMNPHVESDARQEIARRALTFWKKQEPIDLERAPTLRYVVKKSLAKGEARGGKYYRRVPTGNPKSPWRYYYTREDYEAKHGKDAHLHGPEVKQKQLGLDFDAPARPDPKPATAVEKVVETVKEHVVSLLSKFGISLNKVRHLSDLEAANHLEIVHDIKYSEAIAEVAKHRYGLDVDAYRSAKASKTLPARIDRPAMNVPATKLELPSSTMDRPGARLPHSPTAPVMRELVSARSTLGERTMHEMLPPEAGNASTVRPRKDRHGSTIYFAKIGEHVYDWSPLQGAWVREVPVEAAPETPEPPIETEAEGRERFEAERELREAGEPDAATLAQFKEGKDRQNNTHFTSPDGVYRLYELSNSGKWNLSTKQTYDGSTTWEDARNSFMGTKAEAMQEALRREEAIRRQTVTRQKNVDRYNAEQRGEVVHEHMNLPIGTLIHSDKFKYETVGPGEVRNRFASGSEKIVRYKVKTSKGTTGTLDLELKSDGSFDGHGTYKTPGGTETRLYSAKPAGTAPAKVEPASNAKPGHTTVGGDTFMHRNTIKRHGGQWDGSTKTWRVPNEKVNRLKLDLTVQHDHDHESGVLTLGRKQVDRTAPTPPPEQFVAPVETLMTVPTTQVETPSAETPTPPPMLVPAQTLTFGGEPPGGWRPEDRVPEDKQREYEAQRLVNQEREQAERAAKQTQREKHTRMRFKAGQIITIDGKQQYRVQQDEKPFAGIARSVVLEPVGGRTKEPKILHVRENGSATTQTLRGKPQEIDSIEGGTSVDEAWSPPVEKTPEPPTSTPPPAPPPPPETPRGEAVEETKKMEASEQYVNDRKSAVEQRGEDVLGSARHKMAEWKSLQQALDSTNAEEMFTKDFLSRQEPIDLISRAQRDSKSAPKMFRHLYLHLCAAKFPGKPEIPDLYPGMSYVGDRLVTGEYSPHTRKTEHVGEKPTKEEHEKKQRQSYYRAYMKVKETIEKLADAGNALNFENADVFSIRNIDQAAKEAFRKLYDESYAEYGRNDAGTEAIRKMYNGIVKFGKLSPLKQLNDFAGRVQKVTPDGDVQKRMDVIAEKSKLIIEGKSMNAAFDMKKSRTTDIDVASLYNTDVMERQGPASEFKSSKQALDSLDKHAGGKYGMRGVQWGKSVTDEERHHHLKSVVDSFADLTDVLGLPAGMASFNGKLALAIGARGKGNALAHYEPGAQVINLTRSRGAGALAHEWGHFFDNALMTAAGHATGGEKQSSKQYASSASLSYYPASGPVFDEMRALQLSPAMDKFKSRLRSNLRDRVRRNKMSSEKADYWASGIEVFARTFERYVQRKLHHAGRENTYLSGLVRDGEGTELWPTDAETDELIPHFDAVFAAFAKSDMLHKALGVGRYFVRRDRMLQ